jgi:hypothetical protein
MWTEVHRDRLRGVFLGPLGQLSSRTRDATALRLATQILQSDGRGGVFNPDVGVPNALTMPLDP